MGGCCCCCAERNYPPPPSHNIQNPTASARGVPLSSNHGPVSVLSTGLLVGTNLEATIPETYRPPPAPVPYDTPVGRPQILPHDGEICGNKNEIQPTDRTAADANSGRTPEAMHKDADAKADKNAKSKIELLAVKEVGDGLDKCGDLKNPCEPFIREEEEEEDVCPTCLEEYDIENPKILTKCQHHFHLACILEWMERSDTCPVCDQEMVFSTANESEVGGK